MTRGTSHAGGIYVGTSPANVEWVAYRTEDFGPMCAAFDESFSDGSTVEEVNE